MTKSLKTIFMGTPDFAVPTLEMLASQTDLQLVVTQPDRRKGRGKKLLFSPVKERALELGVEVIGPSVVKGKRFTAAMAEYAPDVIVTAAFGRILGPGLLDLPRYGCLNVHASLLPRYRGAAPINWAIINGEKETGVSIMRTVQQLDAGDIYNVKRLSIGRAHAGELTEKLSHLGATALLETLEHIYEIDPVPQDDAQATYAPVMTKADGKLDWKKSALVLERQIRGMYPWPGTYTVWDGANLKIHAAEVIEGAAELSFGVSPGTIVSHTQEGVDVACGEGKLRIISLQMPGRNRLDAKQFYSGVKFKEGSSFG
ncbi:MAG: methionyl-tRNA formyltransferase [Deltaproteobacteria bacterium]|nr:methionyl-tRNA formyltransferase [Deltaproteobacteria bacterium]